MHQEGGLKRFVLSGSMLIMALIYGSYLAIDIHTGFSDSSYSRIVRYLAIIICLGLVFMAGKDANNPADLTLMKWALVFTACADFMMSMICNFSIFSFGNCTAISQVKFGIGTLFFIAVQLILIKRHGRNFKWSFREVLTAVVVFAIMIDKIIRDSRFLLKGDDSSGVVLLVVLAIYGIILCVSVWMAIGTLWRGYFPKQSAWLITIGMVLFFLCDNSLARAKLFPEHNSVLSESSFILVQKTIKTAEIKYIGDQVYVYTDDDQVRELVIPYTLRSIAGILVWFFYLPAQILLMLSTYNPDYLHSVFGTYPRLRGQKPPLLQQRKL